MGFGLSIVIIIHYYELNMAERRHASHAAGIDAVKRASGKKKMTVDLQRTLCLR